ncbi:MAG: hypothetical protein RI885_499 [Actinomycetota bacterium]|jgi:preprotein translocase subunit SecE
MDVLLWIATGVLLFSTVLLIYRRTQSVERNAVTSGTLIVMMAVSGAVVVFVGLAGLIRTIE